MSRYTGRDTDGAWAEGSARDKARIGSVPEGRYFLRVEPEGPPGGPPVRFDLSVRRDVPGVLFFVFALIAILLPPLYLTIQAASFESRRWAESDHAPSSSSDEDE